MTDNILARGNEVINPPVRTSLSDFLAKAEPKETPDVSVDAETTVTEEVSPDILGDASTDTPSVDDGAADSEQVFEVKGNKIPLKELLNAYETREEISRRFSEVGRKEQKVEADKLRAKKEREELDFINEKFEEMHELVLQGNPMAALQIALNMNPKDTTQPKAMKELIEQAVTIAENYQNMDDDERKLFLDKEELSVKERNMARREKKLEAERQATELKSYYEDTLNKNGIQDAEVEAAFEDIQKLPKFKEELEKKNPQERIQYCTSWVLGKRLNNTIIEGIKKVDTKLSENSDFRLALLDHVDPRCTVEDVAAIVREYTKSASSSANGTEASTKGVVKSTTPNRAPTEKPKAENNKPILSWDDIVHKYS